jgi:hypothetical protein
MADMSSKYASLVGPAELAAAAMSSEKVVASGLRWEVGGGAGLTYSTDVQSSTSSFKQSNVQCISALKKFDYGD